MDIEIKDETGKAIEVITWEEFAAANIALAHEGVIDAILADLERPTDCCAPGPSRGRCSTAASRPGSR